MNSRYLFRGKRIDNGDIVIGFYYRTSNGTRIHEVQDEIPFCLESNVHLVDPATIGQCTGVKDKNGNLIFEGDIVRKQMRKNNYYITTIVWIAAGFERHGEHGYHPIHGSELEIIGNVWEDGDLLA